MTKLYRAVAYILDLNGDCPSIKSVIENIENNRHPEFIHVHEVLETDCGEWNDDHELNYANAPYEKYFPEINPKVGEAELDCISQPEIPTDEMSRSFRCNG